MSVRTITAFAVLSISAWSCSGGGRDGNPPPAPIPNPPAVSSPGGFWEGFLAFDSGQASEEFVALTTDDGRFRFLSVDSELQFVGTLVVDGASATGIGLGYADTGSTWLDGSVVTEASATLMLVERASLSGSWGTGSGESGTFEFSYDAEYERASSLSLLAGVWTAYDDFGNPAATFSIDDQGGLNGQNVGGCTSAGQFSIIDPLYNLYAVNSKISGCFIAGDYEGLAAVGDLATANDVMALSLSNSDRAIVLGLAK